MSVALKEQGTQKGKGTATYNDSDIWEDIEDLRDKILCNDTYCDAVLQKGHDNFYLRFKKKREVIIEVREHFAEIVGKLCRAGIRGEYALRILTRSKTKRKITKFKKAYHAITFNNMLDRFEGMDIKGFPAYKTMDEKIQLSIHSYLKQKGQANYTVNKALAGEVIEFYKESFPRDMKFPTERTVQNKMKQMYKFKDKKKNVIKMELRLREEEIFDIVEPDYR